MRARPKGCRCRKHRTRTQVPWAEGTVVRAAALTAVRSAVREEEASAVGMRVAVAQAEDEGDSLGGEAMAVGVDP